MMMREEYGGGGGGGGVHHPGGGGGGEKTSSPTSSSSGIHPPPGIPPSSSHNHHRMKKLLETYIDSAGRSLTGPSGLEEAESARYKCSSSSGRLLLPPYARLLPPDVELSLDDHGKIHPPAPSPTFHNGGSVTLSRIEDDSHSNPLPPPPLPPPVSSSSLRWQRPRGRSERHLSGEMIRRILERQKAAEKQEFERLQQQQQHHHHHQQQRSKRGHPQPPPPSSSSSSSSHPPPSRAFKSPPVLIARDRGVLEYRECDIWGEKIACFNVGGEDRCCLPQILNSILDSVSLQAINGVCDDLRIYCSTCTPEQLEVLKTYKIIPLTASQCGLITKSDAERVFSVLLDRNPPRGGGGRLSSFKSSPFSFKVQHDCFGKNFGTILPEAYTSPESRCVECAECEGLFSPQKFVCHSHYNAEKRTCHWGFDSNNWRTYLRLSDSYSEEEASKYKKVFRDFKDRYTSDKGASLPSKRKANNEDEGQEEDGDEGTQVKKPRVVEPGVDPLLHQSPLPPTSSSQVQQQPSYSNIYNLYNSWAAVVAGKGYPTPGAWPNSLVTAFKDGKVPPMIGFPGFNPLAAANFQQRLLDVKKEEIKPNVSSSLPPPPPTTSSQLPNKSSQQQLPPQQQPSSPLVSSLSERKKADDPASEPTNRQFSTSLADDINAIRDALEGASTVAKERTLKTLERITARLAQTEMERDIAIANYNDLRRRNRSTEEELHKKRAELRELLTLDHDNSHHQGHNSNTQSHMNNNHLHHNSRPAVTLELLGRSSVENNAYLPKVDLKSPARVIEEREQRNSGSESSRNSAKPASPARSAASPSSSNKSKESEDLRDRMVSMEAELRALRDELNNRKVEEPPHPEEDEDSKKSVPSEVKSEKYSNAAPPPSSSSS